jgi:hypothetical protein
MKVLNRIFGLLTLNRKVIPYGIINPNVTQHTQPIIESMTAKLGYRKAVSYNNILKYQLG